MNDKNINKKRKNHGTKESMMNELNKRMWINVIRGSGFLLWALPSTDQGCRNLLAGSACRTFQVLS
jgi:hypothetical protein